MSRILALDTSTDACSVALWCDGRVEGQFELAAKSHTQRLLPMVDEVLSEAGLSLSQLDAIAYGRGPGSFTGLRICLGVVQGLAFGADLPVVPVSTLQGMAQGWLSARPERQQWPVLPALDARMSEVYWGLYQWHDGVAEAMVKEAVSAPEAVVDAVQGQSLDAFTGCGAGWHYPPLQSLKPLSCEQQWYPDARALVVLAARALAQGAVQAADQAEPLYLRDTVSWKKRERIRR
ncbi:tRNA (adenosine(37)-N6)-threonylcarbamoyltransferase complex dimerization subunit type 1 TsaB [Marinimicrobium alkaliphilum]|uniref:tRNA (adenosine(37)-N6)-threonylcarbamoyltransferase complex dimerization subunit type 1 TsaB n=1 Tax=Marinimicrobium alkaliphilum TaxID=2202654 RepID=UPI000DBACAE5|nr:tRNA (adenosine(37)-N6)-threonylcarbamoyltransferase complex dimerization subunit type 1 TsaB [Marinimicrobium alkaliphilum]